MLFTNASGDLQPYVSWKGPSTKAAIAGYSRPITNKDYYAEPNPTPAGKPNPIKHWRKSLRPFNVVGISRAAYSIQSDIPGANVPLGTDVNCCDEENGIQQVVQQYVAPSISAENGTRVCIDCNPETNVIRSGMTEKMINPYEVDGKIAFKKYSFSTKEYLKSKCKTYDQNISGALRDDVEYYEVKGCCVIPIPYNNENVGPQTRNALDCPDETCNGSRTKVIVKPNNQQYFQQGAVSSSSRLARLKYNTVQSSAASFKSAYQAQAASAGRYRADGNAPYFIKSKDQTICNSVTYFRQGNHTIC